MTPCACDACLRRSMLLGQLGPNVERASTERRRLPALLALSDDELLDAIGGTTRAAVERRLEEFDPHREREVAAASGLWSVCRHGDGFPSRLAEADDGPSMLHALGDPDRLRRLGTEPAVAVVGSRRASGYGLEVASSLARELAAAGITVVSGMALGIDAAAHEGALGRGGLTIAVLGAGADVAYPSSNRELHRGIARDGLVVSEMPPGFAPFRWCFPARNRIMAGLSAMTVVVEGTDRSGSLITAQFAADLGREVGAVPGQVTSTLAAGPNALIADGACVVRSAADVIEALFGPGAETSRSAETPNLDPNLERILAAVERGDGTVDALANDSLPAGTVLAGLTELELMGLVRRTSAGAYVRRS